MTILCAFHAPTHLPNSQNTYTKSCACNAKKRLHSMNLYTLHLLVRCLEAKGRNQAITKRRAATNIQNHNYLTCCKSIDTARSTLTMIWPMFVRPAKISWSVLNASSMGIISTTKWQRSSTKETTLRQR